MFSFAVLDLKSNSIFIIIKIEMRQLLYRTIYNSRINYILRNINKWVNGIIPIKLRIHPSGTICILNEHGKKVHIKTNQTSYLTYLFFWEGGYQNFEYTEIFVKLIKKVNTFYDIGANIGYYSLLASMENAEIKVVSFEPAAGPLYYIRENVRINNFQNIKIEPIALSQKEGLITFYEVKNNKYKYLKHNLSGVGNAGGNEKNSKLDINEVKTSTLDNYVLQHKEKNIDLIKMDTEGTENLILEKSKKVLIEMKPIIICETLFNIIEPELDQIMKSYGYEFYNHTSSGLQKVDTLIRETDNGVDNCFFVHPDKYHLIEEFVVQ